MLAFPNVIRGFSRVQRLYTGLVKKPDYLPKLLHIGLIDGLPGFVSMERGGLVQTNALELSGAKMTSIYVVRNPDKLPRILKLISKL